MSYSDALMAIAMLIVSRARENASWDTGYNTSIAEGRRINRTISDAISIGPLDVEGSLFKAKIILDLSISPKAGAFEFGSGVHNPTGAGTYRLAAHAPNNLLHFFWIKQNKWMKVGAVNHPGVAARPFMAPAIEATKADARAILGSDLRVAISSNINGQLVDRSLKDVVIGGSQ